MELTFAELLQIPTCKIEYRGDSGLLNLPVKRFSIDSRTAQADDIFIALKGDKFDGHQFVSEMQAAGVQFFVVTKEWYRTEASSNASGNFFLVKDTLIALQEISHYFRLKFDIPFLALTGSNGKTTTKEMIAAVLGEKYQVLKNKGNLNNHIGVPLSLFELNQEHRIAVIEMGTNHFGEIAKLAEIANPTCGLITNIGPAHLEFFGSLEGVYRAKSELWQFLERTGGTAFINVDDLLLRKKIPAVKNCITYGFENPANVQGTFLDLDADGRPRFRIHQIEIQLGIAGLHNIYNALAAVAVGLEFDVPLAQIKLSLERFLPSARRMEVIRKNNLTVINDCYNSNPESARKALLTLSQMQAKGKRVAVLADMLELGEWSEKEHRAIGDFVVSLSNIDWLLTFGSLSKLTTERARNLGMKNAFNFENKPELIDYLKQIIAKNDVLLIKGSRGMAMEEVTKGLVES